MRYIIHLLPDEERRLAFDALRDRVAAAIGRNRALDYPTAHVTLVWAIEDMPDAPAPIDPAAILAILERRRGSGPITLPLAAPADTRAHLLLPLVNTPALATLRRALYTETVHACGADTARAARIEEQTWPHLTLAQEIDAARWERGRALLDAETGNLLRVPIVGAELALIGRDRAAGEPYRIIGRVPLQAG